MYSKYNIKEIRLLPMSDEEFLTEKEVREYLQNELPKKYDGEYWYQKHGIDLKIKCQMLFYTGKIKIGYTLLRRLHLLAQWMQNV